MLEFWQSFRAQWRQKTADYAGGTLGALFAIWVWLTMTSEVITFQQRQLTLQLGLAFLMFGYYLGLSTKQRSRAAPYIAGFLITAIIFSYYFSLVERNFSLLPSLGIIGSVGSGFYLGAIRPAAKENRMDAIVRVLFNGGGWSAQLVGVASILNEVLISVAIFAIIVAAIIYGYRKKQEIKDLWNFMLGRPKKTNQSSEEKYVA